MPVTGRHVAFALLSPLVLFGVAEVVTRVCGVEPRSETHGLPNIALVPDDVGDDKAPMRRHETRFFEPSPDLGGLFATDSNSFRGGPHPKSHARLFRVALIGDSVTMGFGVRYGASFAGRVESALRRALPSLDVDVVNAGCAGYSTWQNRVDLDERVLPMAPDFVVFAVTAWNDTRGAVLFDDVTWSERLANHEGGSWLAHSRAFVGLARLLSTVGVGLSDAKLREHEAAVARGESPDGPRVTIDQFLDNLGSMMRRCRERGVRPVIVILPRSAASDAANPEPQRYLAALATLADGQKVPVIDVGPSFPALDASMFFDSVHPNEDGHALIADPLVKLFLGDPGFDLPGWSGRAATTRPELKSIEPAAASAFGDVQAVIRGTGFSASPPRFWIDGDPALVATVNDDSTARVRIPPLSPGVHDVEVQTAAGSARLDGAFTARGPELSVERLETAARIVVTSRPGDRVRIQCALEAADVHQSFGRRFLLKVGKESMFKRTFGGDIGKDGRFTLDVPYAGFTGDPPVRMQAIVEPASGAWPRIPLYSNDFVFGKAE